MAAKKESSFKNMIVALALIPGISALALAGIYNLTKDRIELAKTQKLQEAIGLVLPKFERLEAFSVLPEGAKDSVNCYRAFVGDSLIGTAYRTYTDKGFSGRFWVMIGIMSDGSIYDAMVLEHKETPGLGDKMEKKKSGFTEQYKGLNPKTTSIKVKKDGGSIDAITAATISSRAFSDAVERAYSINDAERDVK